MAKPKSHAALAAPVLSSLSQEELESLSRWLETEEGQAALAKAVEQAGDEISELNRSRAVNRDDLYRPISMHRRFA
jgi:hypothetical protein